MQLAKWQAEVAQNQSRYKCISAGRRSGKTYLSIREICYHARLPNQNIFYITASYRQAKMIAWKLLKEKLLELRWVKKINESELQITLKNESVISLKGAESIHSLRGISLSYCVIDECAIVDPDLFQEIIRPALADQKGGAMFISTPMGKSNWFYDIYNMQEKLPNEWKSWSFTTLEAGFVDAEEIEQARSEMSLKQFRQEFEASFETTEARVAYAFDREANIQELPQGLDYRTLHVGGDFNVSPITACVFVRDEETLYCVDEIQMHNSNTQEMADELKNRYPQSKIFFYPDPSGNQRRTSANGQTDHTILHNAGFIIKAPRKHDAIRDRINATNARFCSADGVRRLFISKSCKYTIESMEKYNFKEGTQVPDKGGKQDFSHQFDALSYCVAFLFPLRREVAPALPQRWGHNIAETV
jgi:PBSX family phage terminase large subunit